MVPTVTIVQTFVRLRVTRRAVVTLRVGRIKIVLIKDRAVSNVKILQLRLHRLVRMGNLLIQVVVEVARPARNARLALQQVVTSVSRVLVQVQFVCLVETIPTNAHQVTQWIAVLHRAMVLEDLLVAQAAPNRHF